METSQGLPVSGTSLLGKDKQEIAPCFKWQYQKPVQNTEGEVKVTAVILTIWHVLEQLTNDWHKAELRSKQTNRKTLSTISKPYGCPLGDERTHVSYDKTCHLL